MVKDELIAWMTVQISIQLATMIGFYSESYESLKHRLETFTQFCKQEFSAFINSY